MFKKMFNKVISICNSIDVAQGINTGISSMSAGFSVIEGIKTVKKFKLIRQLNAKNDIVKCKIDILEHKNAILANIINDKLNNLYTEQSKDGENNEKVQ